MINIKINININIRFTDPAIWYIPTAHQTPTSTVTQGIQELQREFHNTSLLF